MLAKKFVNYSASLSGILRATNSYFIVDLAIIACLAYLYLITLLPNVNT